MADVATARRGDGRDDRETEPGDAPVTGGTRSDWGRDESVAERDEDRAQLILITGLTLAVILVTVVLLLNTAIYTENLATRGVNAGGAEAVEFRDGAVDDLAGIMHREHRNESSDAGVAADFGASAETYARSVSTLRTRDGTVADVDVSVTETGYFIAQNETDGGFRNMTAPDGTTADWTVAGNATRTRNYRLTVDPDSLSDSQSGAFAVVADGSPHGTNATWSASLSRATGDELTVTVTSETDTVSETFEAGPDGNHTVDLTGGTVNGEPFDALVWADGVQTGSDRYDVRYENGDRARGTYHLVVDDRDGGADPDRPSRPYVADAVYSAEVDVYYHTPELEYGDSLRLAPGERDA